MRKTKKENITDQLLSWAGVTVQPHRFGGIEFMYEGQEIGHMHGDHLIDLSLPKSKRDEVVAAGLAQPHHMFPKANWVSVYLKSDQDVKQAVNLLRFKYEYLKKK